VAFDEPGQVAVSGCSAVARLLPSVRWLAGSSPISAGQLYDRFVGGQDHRRVSAGRVPLIWLCTYSPDAGSIQAAGVCFAFFWRIHSAHLGFGDFTAANPVYREARTMVQAGIVVSQFFNSLTVRSDDQSILTIGIFTNRRLLLAGASGIALVGCISYIPVLQRVFGTAGLTVWDWLMLVSPSIRNPPAAPRRELSWSVSYPGKRRVVCE
jgi:hypothetical protein